MLDFAMSKAAVIAVVSLVVLGPERLPRVARTAGALLGRAQRVIDDIKAEVNREIELDKLQQWKGDVEMAAKGMRDTVDASLRQQHAEIDSMVKAVEAEGIALHRAFGTDAVSVAPVVELPERDGWLSPRYDLTPLRTPRKKWRVQRAVSRAWRGPLPVARSARRRRQTVQRSLVASHPRRFF